MGNTGFKYAADTKPIDAQTLTQGGTTTYTTAEIDLDGKAGCEIGGSALYSNHAKATAGLTMYILRCPNGTTFQGVLDLPYGVEVPFTQNDTRLFMLPSIDASQVRRFKIFASWLNTTGGSNVLVNLWVRTNDVPLAS